MQQINEIQLREQETSGSKLSQKGTPLKLKECEDSQNQLTTLLYQTFACQKTYAEKAEMMEYREQMFQLILGNFTVDQVRGAFVKHIQESSELPTPHDIYKHLVPQQKKPDWMVYKALKDNLKNDVYVTPKEREYVRWCETFSVEAAEPFFTKQLQN